ncbi:MAG: hypothetical protein QHH15_00540 [Candidatus Thermoplasmatota archaeon]|nr:hypothetical protein [Candidatus Thermoplasmatota archaeon]MDH7506262.1 hypothetical protein [Candidatus Thermoplasmatota archaeon]
MAIGDWVIDDFIPSNVVNVEYKLKEINLTCVSFKKDDGSDPVDEILQIQDKVAFGYDNTSIIGGGTVLQSYDPDDIFTITDGYESFIGIVSNVTVSEDEDSDYYIKYNINIVRYIPPKAAVTSYELEDGDETVFDDDWEMGYESYSADGCKNNTSNIAATYKWVAGTRTAVSVYRHEYIQGQPYKAGYGYLMPGDLKDTFPVNLVGYTVVLFLHEAIKNVLFNIAYGGAGKATVGEFGEIIYVPATQIPDAIFSVNGHNYNIPWKAGNSIDNIIVKAFMLRVSDVIDEEDRLENGGGYIAMRVSTPFPTFYLQSVTGITSEVTTTTSTVCEEKDNEVPVYQAPSGGMAGGGPSRPNPALYGNAGSYNYNWKTMASSGSTRSGGGGLH